VDTSRAECTNLSPGVAGACTGPWVGPWAARTGAAGVLGERWNGKGVVSLYRVKWSNAFARRTFCASSRLMGAEGGVRSLMCVGEGGVGGSPCCDADADEEMLFLSTSASLPQKDASYTVEEADEPGEGGQLNCRLNEGLNGKVRIHKPKPRREKHAHLDSVEWRGRSSVEDVGCVAEAASTLRDRTLRLRRSRKSVRNGLREGLPLSASGGCTDGDTSWVSTSCEEGTPRPFECAGTVRLNSLFGSPDGGGGAGAGGVWGAWIGDTTTCRGLGSGDRPSRVFAQSA
jgi:hypothetical protein